MTNENKQSSPPAELRSDKVETPPVVRDEAKNLEDKGEPFDGMFA